MHSPSKKLLVSEMKLRSRPVKILVANRLKAKLDTKSEYFVDFFSRLNIVLNHGDD